MGVAVSLEGRSHLIASRVHDLCQNAKAKRSETQVPSGGRRKVSGKISDIHVYVNRGERTSHAYVNRAKRVKETLLSVLLVLISPDSQ